MMILGIDIGGTKVAVGVADEMGRLLARERRTTAELGDGEPLLEGTAAMADAALAAAGATRDDVAAVGVALPGPVDRRRGAMEVAPRQPGLAGRSLTGYFGARFGARAVADNDANVAALGEYRFGAGRGARVMAYFTVSTGVGGAVIAGGRVWDGAAGHAAEFGHQIVVPEGGPPCDCGGHGCLESVASGSGIARRATRAVERAPDSRLLVLAGGDPAAITAAMVAEAAAEGDATARAVWDDTTRFLGIGIANVIVLFDTDRVVLGGGVTRAGEALLGPARVYALARVMPGLRRDVRILPAALGDDAGIIGAVALALDSGAAS